MITVGHPLPLPDMARWSTTREFLRNLDRGGVCLEGRLYVVLADASFEILMREAERPHRERFYRAMFPLEGDS